MEEVELDQHAQVSVERLKLRDRGRAAAVKSIFRELYKLNAAEYKLSGTAYNKCNGPTTAAVQSGLALLGKMPAIQLE